MQWFKDLLFFYSNGRKMRDLEAKLRSVVWLATNGDVLDPSAGWSEVNSQIKNYHRELVERGRQNALVERDLPEEVIAEALSAYLNHENTAKQDYQTYAAVSMNAAINAAFRKLQ
jgi:hypothetical protein